MVARTNKDPAERLLAALRSPFELKGALDLIAEWGLRELRAAHCSVFVLDGQLLHPAAAAGSCPSAVLWTAFRSIGPIEVDPSRWELFGPDGTFMIEDVRASALVPPAWIERFNVRSIAFALLAPGGQPAGLLAVDWSEPHHCTAGEVAFLGQLGSYAAMAIGAARPFERVDRHARRNDVLARAAARLGAPLDLDAIVAQLVQACWELLDPRCCVGALVNLDQGLVERVATRGTRALPAAFPLSAVPPSLARVLADSLTYGTRAVELGEDHWLTRVLGLTHPKVAHYLAIPMYAGAEPCGGVLLGFGPHTRPDAEDGAAALTLCAYAGAAVERRQLLDALAIRCAISTSSPTRMRRSQSLARLAERFERGRGVSPSPEAHKAGSCPS